MEVEQETYVLKVLSVPIAEEYIKIPIYGQQMQQLYQLLWYIHTEFIQR